MIWCRSTVLLCGIYLVSLAQLQKF
uniref:Uncharacterized protein n=1 Tax=Anguilla anguilla TaxID=7936 RepID=A0A0E9P814_ANGAN